MDLVQQTGTNQMQTGKSKDPFKMWTMVFGVLLLPVVGFGVWQYMQLNTQNSKVTSLEATNSQLQTSKTALQAELDELKGVDTSATTDTDKNKILAATDAYVRAPVAATGDFEYAITKNDGKFATVTASVPGGTGYILWLKKVDTNWTVLFGGQEQPGQELIDKYGLSKTVI